VRPFSEVLVATEKYEACIPPVIHFLAPLMMLREEQRQKRTGVKFRLSERKWWWGSSRGLLVFPVFGLDGGRLDPLDVTPRIRLSDR
jgi:hypothetical protein